MVSVTNLCVCERMCFDSYVVYFVMAWITPLLLAVAVSVEKDLHDVFIPNQHHTRSDRKKEKEIPMRKILITKTLNQNPE